MKFGMDLLYLLTYRGSQIVARRAQPDGKKKNLPVDFCIMFQTIPGNPT